MGKMSQEQNAEAFMKIRVLAVQGNEVGIGR